MLKISVIVAAYNVAPYIESCLESICAQTYADWEALVVNDASTDETLALIEGFAARDSRIKVVNQEVNRGRHQARLAGARACDSDYALFLDGDDDLLPDFLEGIAQRLQEKPVDILHFGLTVVGENGILADEVDAFDQFNNRPVEDLSGLEIVRQICDPAYGYAVDWRVTQRVFETGLLKRGFEQMLDERLDRTEDGYECVVLSALAQTYSACKENKGYVYHYGRGITGTNQITAEKYGQFCEQFEDCFKAAELFAQQHPGLDMGACILGFRRKATELLANDWLVRLPLEEKQEAAQLMAQTMGGAVAAREIWRHICDNVWNQLQQKAGQLPQSEYKVWAEIADSLDDKDGTEAEVTRCDAKRIRAKELLQDLDKKNLLVDCDNHRIRIFVSVSTNVNLFASTQLQPLQLGCATAGYRLLWALHDDQGESISNQYGRYGHLTALYWAWKNVDTQYYGFCSQSRYFDFSAVHLADDDGSGESYEASISQDSQFKYALDDSSIRAAARDYDLIYSCYAPAYVYGGGSNAAEVWKNSPVLHASDLDLVQSILAERYPDYVSDFQQVLAGNQAQKQKIFVMCQPVFRKYCAWLFDILQTYVARADVSLYGNQALMAPSYLGDYLFSAFLAHQIRCAQGFRAKMVRSVSFIYAACEGLRYPFESESSETPVVPIATAVDERYMPMLATTIESIIQNGSSQRRYYFLVMYRNTDWKSREIMRRHFESTYPNVVISYYDVSAIIDAYHLNVAGGRPSPEIYYRFLVQKIMPLSDKVIYLDPDTIVLDDIAQLYSVELGDNLVAAVRDIEFAGHLNEKGSQLKKYCRDVLNISNPYNYFQTGVLVLNTKAMRQRCTFEEWIKMAAKRAYVNNDRDALNVHCYERVYYLDAAWNVLHNSNDRVQEVFSQAPSAEYDAYLQAAQAPKIVHYAGDVKPWETVNCDKGNLFWKYAQNTPFYERLLYIRTMAKKGFLPHSKLLDTLTDSGLQNPLRQASIVLLPEGSKQRELARNVINKLRDR